MLLTHTCSLSVTLDHAVTDMAPCTGSDEAADSKQLPWAGLSHHPVAKQLATGNPVNDGLPQAQAGVHCSATAAGVVC